jgi:hypothetical protein
VSALRSHASAGAIAYACEMPSSESGLADAPAACGVNATLAIA